MARLQRVGGQRRNHPRRIRRPHDRHHHQRHQLPVCARSGAGGLRAQAGHGATRCPWKPSGTSPPRWRRSTWSRNSTRSSRSRFAPPGIAGHRQGTVSPSSANSRQRWCARAWACSVRRTAPCRPTCPQRPPGHVPRLPASRRLPDAETLSSPLPAISAAIPSACCRRWRPWTPASAWARPSAWRTGWRKPASTRAKVVGVIGDSTFLHSGITGAAGHGL